MPITPDGGIYAANHTAIDALVADAPGPLEQGLVGSSDTSHLTIVEAGDSMPDLPDHDISGVDLTASEALNLYYASIGLTARATASRLVLEEPTIKTHRASVMRKMGTYTMHGAVSKAITTGKLGVSVTNTGTEELGISRPQLELIEIAALDFNYPGIAEVSHKSVATIRSHALAVRQKLGANTLPHAVRLGFEARIITAASLRDRAEELKSHQAA